MAVNVLGGPLEFSMSIDTDGLEQQITDGIEKASAVVTDYGDTLADVARKASSVFDPTFANKFVGQLRDASAQITELLQKGADSLNPKSLDELQVRLSSTQDEFDQLRIVTGFIKDNLGDFKFSDQDITKLSGAIDQVNGAFKALTGSEKDFVTRLGTVSGSISGLSGSVDHVDQLNKSLSTLENSLFEVIQKSSEASSQAFDTAKLDQFLGDVKGAADQISRILASASGGFDPASLEALKQSIGGAASEFEQLKSVTSFIRENINSLDLQPDQVAQLAGAVDQVNASFQRLTGSETKLTDGLDSVAGSLKGVGEGTDQIRLFNEVLSQAGENVNKAFDPQQAEKFVSTVQQASAKVTQLLQRGVSGLDPKSLEELQGQLSLTVGEFDKLKIVTGFIKNNLGKLNLSDDEVKQLAAAIGVVESSFKGVNDQEDTATKKLRALKEELKTMAANGVEKSAPAFQAKLTEAAELEEAVKNVNKQLKLVGGDVPGLEALNQGFRGLIGGAEAAAGFVGLFSDEEGKAEVITKNLIATMSILNGVKELGDIITKKSALNEFLLAKYRQLTAAATVAETAAQVGSTAAQEAGVAVTEAATVAQEGLNAAMLANPVAIVLGSVIALYGAYELLASTVFDATDAEKERKEILEAEADVQKKAAGAIADELVNLQSRLKIAQDNSLTDRERGEALDEIRQKYPEYLSNLTQEELLTGKASDAIREQIDLMRKRAVAAAAGEVEKERLKELITRQVELNLKLQEGTSFFGGLKDDRLEAFTSLSKAQKEYKVSSEVAAKAQKDLQGSSQTTAEKIDALTASIEHLQATGGSTGWSGVLISSLKLLREQAQRSQAKLFDPDAYEKDKAAALAAIQFKIDASKKGSAEELRLRKELAVKTQELARQDQRIFDQFGSPKVSVETGKAVPEALAVLGQTQSEINSINEEITQRFLQSVADSAQAVVLALTTAGKKGSEAYFDAQRDAVKKAAAAEIVQANDNAGTIRKIKAQLALDLQNIDIEQQRQSLENEKSILNIKLTLAAEGSKQELDLRKQLLQNAADEEILAAGKNADKIAEIKAKLAKDQSELQKKFDQQAQQDQVSTIIANVNAQLAAVQEGSAEELRLKKEAVADKAKLDILSAQSQIKNEALLAARITEIRAKSIADQRKLDEAYYRDLLNRQLDLIQQQADLANSKLQVTIDNPASSRSQRQSAETEQIRNDLAAAQAQAATLDFAIKNSSGDTRDLINQYSKLLAKIEQLKSKFSNKLISNKDADFRAAADDAQKIAQYFDELSQAVGDTNPGLSNMFDQITSIAKVAAGLISTFANVKKQIDDFNTASKKNDQGKTDLAGQIGAGLGIAGAVVGVVSSVVKFFKAAKESRKQAQAEIEAFNLRSLIGEQEITQELRNRQREQVKLNKLKIQGLQDEKTLLESQRSAIKAQYDDIFNQLQQQSFVADEVTKKYGGILGIGRKSKAVEVFQSLAGKSFEEIEKLFSEGRLTGKAKELFQMLQKIKQEGADVDAMLAANAEAFKQAITGTTLDSLVDSIASAFEAGKRGASDFADTFQDLMRKALLESLKMKYLQAPLQDFFNQFADLAGTDSQLTDAEIAQLRDTFNGIINNASQQFEALQQIAGVSFATGSSGSVNSLTGAIKGMTEGTAELLAGQFAGQRLATLDLVTIQRSAAGMLDTIQANTGAMVVKLSNLIGKFDAYETGAKKISVAV